MCLGAKLLKGDLSICFYLLLLELPGMCSYDDVTDTYISYPYSWWLFFDMDMQTIFELYLTQISLFS